MSVDLDTCTERMGLWLAAHGTTDGIDRWNAVYEAMSARLAAADAAMALVERAANHLQKNGMNPGWGTAKDDLNAALAIYRATAPASPTSEGDET